MALKSRLLLCAAATVLALPASAAVIISSAPTKNVSCSAGVCAPTAKGAVLNVSDLESMLAGSDVTVNSGSGAVTIEIDAPLAWASAHRLTLNADFNVNIKAAVAVEGTSGLTVTYDNAKQGGQLQFFPGGKVDFWDTNSALTVNGNKYTLLNDLASLVRDTTGGSSGAFAFAKDYDAGADGTYRNGVVGPIFQGTLEGLGHTISNLSIQGHNGSGSGVGMFEQTGGVNGAAILRDFTLANVSINTLSGQGVGALVGTGSVIAYGVSSSGTITSGGNSQTGGLIGLAAAGSSVMKSSSSASVTAGGTNKVGGLVGSAFGPIVDCQASGAVSGGRKSIVGGLVGYTQSQIDQSFATGNVQTNAPVFAGGLVGENGGTITNSYATGAVHAGNNSHMGGLLGGTVASLIATSYSIGPVGAPNGKGSGGFIGRFTSNSQNTNDVWDVDTSGQSTPCGNACSGVTGLSDAQLKSGLPAGFDAAIWAQSAQVNNGYPYLIANPPQ